MFFSDVMLPMVTGTITVLSLNLHVVSYSFKLLLQDSYLNILLVVFSQCVISRAKHPLYICISPVSIGGWKVVR